VAARAKRGKTLDRPASAGLRKERKVLPRRSCFFCKGQVAAVDYKNLGQLRRFITERGKIRGRANTGTCRKHQKQVAVAIKRAREMALLPYVGGSQEAQARSHSRRGDDLPASS
jgi:small subunit ribosomal protein S18